MGYPHQVLWHLQFPLRRLYYPGAGTDHGPFRVFGRLPSVRQVIHCDYITRKEEAERLFRKQKAWRVLRSRSLNPRDLGVESWAELWYDHRYSRRHRTPDTAYGVQARVLRSLHWRDQMDGGAPRLLVARGDRVDGSRGDSARPTPELRHEGHRTMRSGSDLARSEVEGVPDEDEFDALYLGTEAVGTFEALVNAGLAPDAVVLQDHGFGANWSSFGHGGELFYSARRLNAWPTVLLVGDGTSAWNGYEAVSDPRVYAGACNGFTRTLYVRDDLSAELLKRAGAPYGTSP